MTLLVTQFSGRRTSIKTPVLASPATVQLRLSTESQFETAQGQTFALAPRDAALLAWLAVEGPTARLRLAQLLWPEHDDDAARNSLRQRLFKLRKQTGLDLVLGSSTLTLAEGLLHDLDGADELLGLQPLHIGVEFDHWLAHQRQRRLQRVRGLRSAQLQSAEEAGDYPGALALAQDWLTREPHLEEAHRLVMRLHYLNGDCSAARQAFLRCTRALAEGLGARPGADTLAVAALIDSVMAPPFATAASATTAASAATASPAANALARVPAGVLRPPRLVGRDAECGAAQAAWAKGQVVAVVGEAGMGKTRLLQHLLSGFCDAAHHSTTLHVAARPGDAGVPLATLARLLRAVTENGQQVLAPAARREIARVLPEWSQDALPIADGQRLLLQRAVQALLAQQQTLHVVALDDLHFADAASLHMLQALLDDGDCSPNPLHWALAYRPAEADSALQALHAGLLEQARLQPVLLAPLDIHAVAALVDSLGLVGIHGAALAPGLWRRTGGNPLFVLETLKQAWVEKRLASLADVQDLPRPLSVARLIERRLTQLSAPALALARCAAVAGQAFSTGLAASVLGQSALGLADAWAELEAAQVLRDQAFVHDLFFEAALASVPAAIARHLHAEIAAYLESQSLLQHNSQGHVPAATLASHWLAAGRPERAAAPLARAAQAAAQALDPAEAARLWAQLADLRRSAGDLAAAYEAARSVVLALRSVTSHAPLAGAIDSLAALAALTQSAQHQADVHELRAAMFHARGEHSQAAASVALGLAALPPDAPAASRISLLNMHGVVLRHAGQPQAARSALQQALALARSSAAPDADLPAVLNNLGLLLQSQDDHLQAIALMQEAAALQTDPLVRARVVNNVAISLEERGQVAQAREQRLSAARSALGTGGVVELNLAISLGANARNLGRYRDALLHLEHARTLMAGRNHLREEEMHRQLAAVWIDLGRLNLAREALDQARLASTAPARVALVEIVSARLALALGKGPEALACIAAAEPVLQQAADQRALRRLWLVKAQALEPAAALQFLERLLAEPAVRDNVAASLPVQVRMAQALLRLQQPALALSHAQRAAHWLQAVSPLEMSPAEVQLTLARCLLAGRAPDHAAQEAQAAAALQVGNDWVQHVAMTQVDEIYRDGWLQRNRVNGELQALAAKLGGGGA